MSPKWVTGSEDCWRAEPGGQAQQQVLQRGRCPCWPEQSPPEGTLVTLGRSACPQAQSQHFQAWKALWTQSPTSSWGWWAWAGLPEFHLCPWGGGETPHLGDTSCSRGFRTSLVDKHTPSVLVFNAQAPVSFLRPGLSIMFQRSQVVFGERWLCEQHWVKRGVMAGWWLACRKDGILPLLFCMTTRDNLTGWTGKSRAGLA